MNVHWRRMNAHLKHLVSIKMMLTPVFVILDSKVMAMSAMISMNVPLMTHVLPMPHVPILEAVILVAVTLDMKAMDWFVENKQDAKTLTSARLVTIVIQVRNAAIPMAPMNAHVPMGTLVMAKIVKISMNVKMVMPNVTKTLIVSMSQEVKIARVTSVHVKKTILMPMETEQNALQLTNVAMEVITVTSMLLAVLMMSISVANVMLVSLVMVLFAVILMNVTQTVITVTRMPNAATT